MMELTGDMLRFVVGGIAPADPKPPSEGFQGRELDRIQREGLTPRSRDDAMQRWQNRNTAPPQRQLAPNRDPIG
jgi:hypothetical protein